MPRKSKNTTVAQNLETVAAIETAPVISHEELDAMIADSLTDEDLEMSTETAAEDTPSNDAPAEDVQTEPASDDADEKSFAEIRDSYGDSEVTALTFATAAAIDARAAFEEEKNPDNANIHKTLKKAREQLVTKRAARVFLACGVSPDFINRTLHDGSRYNVYALGKLADIVKGVTDEQITNAINLACMKSLFAFKRAGFDFTGEMARAAASDKVRVDGKFRKILISHTVSASTAPTQASSTMSALETLGVVSLKGSRRNPTYIVNQTPLAAFLEEKLAA